ncbi:hypothetical protein PI124_g21640 [Phytophthora idaei]|nr:hypothetical protein PI125_g17028 [Phytophthora idaei]KAG3128238.1 hypothetical protein PI126_g21485 [Phytophthora idaei]KAG3233279.1 hypothetical protein PI124_g21640 [Phytophthora idaei]
MPCDWRPQAPSIDRACAEAQVGEDLPGPSSRYLPNDGIDRVDYDESLLPEDSSERESDDKEFEVERIADVRSGRRTRYGRALRVYLVYWKGYREPS